MRRTRGLVVTVALGLPAFGAVAVAAVAADQEPAGDRSAAAVRRLVSEVAPSLVRADSILSGAATVEAKGVSSWSHRFAGAEEGADPLVDSGRVWWTRADTRTDTSDWRFWLVSRAFSGGPTRKVSIVLPGPAVRAPTGSSMQLVSAGIRVSGGELFAAGMYCERHDQDSGPCQPPFAARYSATTGKPLPVPFPQVTSFVGGFPLVGEIRQADGSLPVIDWRTGPTPTVQPAGSGSVQAAGKFIAWTEGTTSPFGRDTGPGRHWDLVRVVEIATGKTVYTVTSKQIARRAAGDHVRVEVPRLIADGSLAVTATRTAERRGLRPVWVDGAGAVQRSGRTVAFADSAAVLVAGRRAFVSVGGGAYRSRGPRKGFPCQATWVTDIAGDRGRLVGSQAPNGRSREGLPLFWDGHHALWVYGTNEQEVSNAIRVDNDLDRLRLSTRDRPSCPKR